MKWLADIAAVLVAAASLVMVARGTNPAGVGLAVVAAVVSVLFLCRRIQHGFDQIDLAAKPRREVQR